MGKRYVGKPLKKVDVIREEFTHLYLKNGDTKLSNIRVNRLVTMVNGWFKNRFAHKLAYQIRPRGFRTYKHGGPVPRIDKKTGLHIYKTVWNEAYNDSIGIDNNFIRMIMACVINSGEDNKQAFFPEKLDGYNKKNEKHVLLSDYIVRKFRADHILLKFPKHTNYNLCSLMQLHIKSLCINMITRGVFPIELRIYIILLIVYIFIYVYICVYMYVYVGILAIMIKVCNLHL